MSPDGGQWCCWMVSLSSHRADRCWDKLCTGQPGMCQTDCQSCSGFNTWIVCIYKTTYWTNRKFDTGHTHICNNWFEFILLYSCKYNLSLNRRLCCSFWWGCFSQKLRFFFTYHTCVLLEEAWTMMVVTERTYMHIIERPLMTQIHVFFLHLLIYQSYEKDGSIFFLWDLMYKEKIYITRRTRYKYYDLNNR